MKKLLLTSALAMGLFVKLFSQCITINCPPSASVNNDPGVCGAVVNFTAPVANSTCVAAVTDTFLYSGAMQTYVVPAGVTTVTIETWGAQGGANWVNNVNFGGYSKADFPVTPGETLYIYVGEQPTTITGGFNGGGNGEGAGKGGGGASDVRQGGTTLNSRIIVGGGGGGAGYWSNLHVVGGVGGGLTGGNGYRDPDFSSNPGGLGGGQSSAGANGTCVSFNNPACAGGFGYGGAPSGCGCEGYGGGGGWYGGAGSGNCRGGGGGSGYVLPLATNPTMTQGITVGNGKVVIAYNASTTSPTVTQTTGLASGATFPVGVTTNTFVASDAFGNNNTCSFQVTVTDNEAPVISGLPSSTLTVNNDAGQCNAVVTWAAPTVTDNCSSIVTTQNHNSGDVFPLGNTTVTYSSTDGTNVTTTSFTVTVVDNEAPVINSCPPNVTMCPGIINFTSAPTATDNCSSATVAQTGGPTDGSSLTAGTYTVTYTATDAASNTSNCSFMITVNANPNVTLDLASLSFTCLSNPSFALAGENPGGGTWSGPGVTASMFDPAGAGLGFWPIVYTYTDINGCTASATDTIQVDVCTGMTVNGVEVFKMYPNPASASFWFISTETGTMDIMDVNGKLLHSEKINSNKQEIDLNAFATGTYMVRFTSDKGDISTGQLLIQK
jgi:hypothetical protein